MTQTTQKREPHSRRLWLMFLSGPVVYSVYFLVVYSIGEFGCLAGLQFVGVFGWSAIRFSVAVLTVVSALITLGAGIFSFRRWRRRREEPDEDDENAAFILFVSTWLNGLFTVITLLTSVPMLSGSYCQWI